MKKFLLLIFLLCPVAIHAQGVEASKFRETTFAKLGSPVRGQVRHVSDGTAGSPCTGGGSGAYAYADGSQWICTTQAPPASGVTIGTTAVSSGTGGRVLYETSDNKVGEISGATSDGTTLTLIAPALGTPVSGVGTNLTGTASGLTAGNVTTNASLTGDVTSVGNATAIASGVVVNADVNASAAISATKLVDGTVSDAELQFINTLSSNAQTQIDGKQATLTNSAGLRGALSDENGTGASLFDGATSPTFVTPALGTPSALVATNISGTAASLTAGNVTTNANLSGVVVSSGSNVTTPGKADVMQSSFFCSDAAANDTYACNLSPAITAYVTGAHYRFKANTLNTGTASLNLNSLGAKTIVKVPGGITTVLATGDILAGQWVDVVYDGTNMQIQSTLASTSSNSAAANKLARSGGAGLAFSSSRITDTNGGAITIDSASGQSTTIGDVLGAGNGTTITVSDSTQTVTVTSSSSPKLSVTGVIINTGITADTAHADTAVCQDTTTHQFYSGTGTLGVCLGTSSLRFKNHVKPLSGGLSEIMALRPISFRYNPGYGDNGARRQYGFAAEEVRKPMPELVGLDANGRANSVDMLGMLPKAILAIQQLNARLTAVENENRRLRALRRHRRLRK